MSCLGSRCLVLLSLSFFLRASLLPFPVPQVDKLLKKYEGRYKEMFQKLDAKYTRTDSRRKVREGDWVPELRFGPSTDVLTAADVVVGHQLLELLVGSHGQRSRSSPASSP